MLLNSETGATKNNAEKIEQSPPQPLPKGGEKSLRRRVRGKQLEKPLTNNH